MYSLPSGNTCNVTIFPSVMSSTLALSSISSPSSQLLFAHFTLRNFGSFFWGHFCLWQKPGFSQFRVLRAPYFALQSTPSALLQSLVRTGSQGRKLFVQWFVFCSLFQISPETPAYITFGCFALNILSEARVQLVHYLYG